MAWLRRKKVNRRIEPAVKRRFPLRAVSLALLFVGAMTLVSWAAVRVDDPKFMPVRYVEIRGGFQHLTPERIRDRVKAVVARNFLLADTGAIQRALADMPWVNRASVTRVWPDTLRVAVVEQRPLARWGGGALVNAAGEVFRPPARAAQRLLPALDGPRGDVLTVVEHYKDAASRLNPLGLGVQSLSLDDRHAWRVGLSNGISLVLGKQDYDARLRRFSRFYGTVLGRRARDVDTVDLRYSNGFAVHWRGAPGA